MERFRSRDNNVLIQRKTDKDGYTELHIGIGTKITISFPIMTLHFWWKGERVMTSIWSSMQTQQAQELIRSKYISITLYYG